MTFIRFFLLPARFGVSISLLTIALVTGCNSGDQVTVYPAQGTVIYHGEPIKGGGSISLVPVGDQAGKAAGGTIDDNGEFVLTTYHQGDGSMPGEFRVVIMQSVSKEPEVDLNSDETQKDVVGEAITLVSEEDRIPGIYSDPLNSPLTVTIEEKDRNFLDLYLED